MLYSGSNILHRSVVRRQTGFAARITRTLSCLNLSSAMSSNPFIAPEHPGTQQSSWRSYIYATVIGSCVWAFLAFCANLFFDWSIENGQLRLCFSRDISPNAIYGEASLYLTSFTTSISTAVCLAIFSLIAAVATCNIIAFACGHYRKAELQRIEPPA